MATHPHSEQAREPEMHFASAQRNGVVVLLAQRVGEPEQPRLGQVECIGIGLETPCSETGPATPAGECGVLAEPLGLVGLERSSLRRWWLRGTEQLLELFKPIQVVARTSCHVCVKRFAPGTGLDK